MESVCLTFSGASVILFFKGSLSASVFVEYADDQADARCLGGGSRDPGATHCGSNFLTPAARSKSWACLSLGFLVCEVKKVGFNLFVLKLLFSSSGFFFSSKNWQETHPTEPCPLSFTPPSPADPLSLGALQSTAQKSPDWTLLEAPFSSNSQGSSGWAFQEGPQERREALPWDSLSPPGCLRAWGRALGTNRRTSGDLVAQNL